MARHGENIRKRKDGRWEGRYKVFDKSKGKCIYRSVYGRDYGEAKEKLSRARFGSLCGEQKDEHMRDGNRNNAGRSATPSYRADRSGSIPEDSGAGSDDGILFSQAADEWLAEVCGRRKYSTYIKYSTVYQSHLAGSVGLYRLCPDAAPELREKIFDHLSGDEMSESLKKSTVCVANQIVSYANVKYSSGIPLLERPSAKAEKKATGAFPRAEQAKLLDCIYEETDRFKVAVLLCLYAGLRLGELCALQWTDIDFGSMTLTVERTVQRIAVPGHQTKTILLETDPKSRSSRRTIPISPELIGMLSGLKGGQPYVFGGEKPLEPRTMQYRFQKILKDAGIDGRNFHILRHTFATNCVESGMDVKALSEILGHSDVKITLNRYIHPTMDSKRKQMGVLADFYGQICGHVA